MSAWMTNLEPDAPDVIPVYTIFSRPRDYPDEIVVRQFKYCRRFQTHDHSIMGPIIAVVKSLEDGVAKIPAGYVLIGRLPEDHPTVVGTWVRPEDFLALADLDK